MACIFTNALLFTFALPLPSLPLLADDTHGIDGRWSEWSEWSGNCEWTACVRMDDWRKQRGEGEWEGQEEGEGSGEEPEGQRTAASLEQALGTRTRLLAVERHGDVALALSLAPFLYSFFLPCRSLKWILISMNNWNL